jgi:hypothetical protein
MLGVIRRVTRRRSAYQTGGAYHERSIDPGTGQYCSAQASGTPFVSFFTLDEMLAVARVAGFREVRCLTAADLTQRYFRGRTDGLRLGNAEALLLATA